MQKDKKLIVYDILFLIGSLYFALLLKFDFNIQQEYIIFFKISVIPMVIITLVFNKVFNLYDSIWKYASVEELISIVYSVSASNVIFVIYSYFINYKFLENRYYRFPYTVHIIFWILSVLALGGIRFIYKINNSSLFSQVIIHILLGFIRGIQAFLVKTGNCPAIQLTGRRQLMCLLKLGDGFFELFLIVGFSF